MGNGMTFYMIKNEMNEHNKEFNVLLENKI